jgi:hypothetical protein
MSYTVIQVPDTYNISSCLKDIILTSSDDVNIKIKIGTDVILEEIYTPDSESKVYVRQIGRLLKNYLSGSGFESNTQIDIVLIFKLLVNDEDNGNFQVLYCDAVTRIDPVNFFNGNVFLHNMKPVKWILPKSKEYKTVFFTSVNDRKVKVFVTVFDGQNYINTDIRVLYTSNIDTIGTIDVSFDLIKPVFTDVDPDTIVAYRLVLPEEIAVYMIDRDHYILPLQFRYRNVFNVPETIVTRGDVVRKGVSTFEKSRVSHVDRKFNVERSDEFSVNSGKIFSSNDYDRYAELFNSEDVEILYAGEWKKIIVKENDSPISLRSGSLNQKSFTFTFADPEDNNILLGESFLKWILSGGTWIDDYMWIDKGRWNDNPS